MAEDKGVPVVSACRLLGGEGCVLVVMRSLGRFEKMAGWKELMALAPKP